MPKINVIEPMSKEKDYGVSQTQETPVENNDLLQVTQLPRTGSSAKRVQKLSPLRLTKGFEPRRASAKPKGSMLKPT